MPIEAVILGLDPALHKSGAAILYPDYGGMDEDAHPFEGNYVLHEFGKVVSQRERERFIESFLDLAEELGLPPLVMAEEWDPPRDRKVRLVEGGYAYVKDQRWTYETILGVGAGWGKWDAELEMASEHLREESPGHPGILVARVTPNVWRDALFGPRRPRDSEALKLFAQRYYEGVFGYAASSDIAEAGCIALHATTSSTAEALVSTWLEQKTPPRKRKRAS